MEGKNKGGESKVDGERIRKGERGESEGKEWERGEK